MIKKLPLLASVALMAISAQATELGFSYNLEGVPTDYYGTSKKELYDIAICLDNPSLAGKKITRIEVPVNGDVALYSNPGAFLTSELKVERVDGKRVNVADICTVTATIADGKLTATFDEPYTLTTSPVYVGYTIEVEELRDESRFPIAVVPGNNENGLWLHSSRTQLKWANYVNRADGGMQSDMTVFLEGDFAADSASPQLPERMVAQTGMESTYSFSVVNGGSAKINSVDFTWKAADKEGAGSYAFETPVRDALGAIGTASFTLPAFTENGIHNIDVTVTKVNGADNVSSVTTAQSRLIIAPEVPVNRPFVEEYTGLWCGWCVRGYAALEWMNEEQPDRFVAAAWHNSDEMAVTNKYPSSISGYPAAWINRSTSLDPGSIPAVWTDIAAMPTDFSIKCELDFTDESKSAVKAKAYVSAIDDFGAGYKIGYLLIADGLSQPKWFQSNYYSGNPAQAQAELPEKYVDMFVNGPEKFPGLIFNDVVIGFDNAMGVPNSLPGEIKAFEVNTNEVEFSLTDIRNLQEPTPGNPDSNLIPLNLDKILVEAFIIAPNGSVVNSCKSNYAGQPFNAVEAIESEAEVVDTVWYDLSGRIVKAPARGIYVRMQTLSDGSRRAAKIAVK